MLRRLDLISAFLCLFYGAGVFAPALHRFVLEREHCERCHAEAASGDASASPESAGRPVLLDHDHHAHDPQTCSLCQLGNLPLLRVSATVLPGLTAKRGRLPLVRKEGTLCRTGGDDHLPRGPPAIS